MIDWNDYGFASNARPRHAHDGRHLGRSHRTWCLGGHPHHPRPGKAARRGVAPTDPDRRFASGEIDAEQYADARRILEGRVTVTPTPHG